MFEKFRVVVYFLLIVTSNATLVTLAVSSCSTNENCPESYYCKENTCKKCLSCSLLFRKGNSCVIDFIECGDCLPGYEEISVTVNSVIKKPCKLVKNNIPVTECSVALNAKNCPPNNYCSEGSCVKCFDCTVVNRLPPADNCAKGLTECGSCRNGYQEVSVTTFMNTKPCDVGSVKILKKEFTQIFQELSIIGVVSVFLVVTLILYVYTKKNGKARSSSKSNSLCAVIPSAPPLHVMLEEKEREDTLKKGEIKREQRQTEYSTLSFVNEQMQQAKVFQQPNAAYYSTEDERSHESSIRNQSEVDVRRLSLQLGINTIRGFSFSEQLNETVSETGMSQTVGSDMRDGVPRSNNTDMELVQLDVSDVRIMPTTQQPSEINIESEDTDDANSSCDEDANSQGGLESIIAFAHQIQNNKKCRHLLFLHPEITLFTAHGESYSNVSVKYVTCSTIQEDNIWFLQDNNLPPWISELVNNSNWTKGKLNCPNCQGRLGSFDFVSGTQCQCGSHVLPPVHIVKCKVDCRNQG